MKQILLATTALSLCLTLAGCDDDKGGNDNSSTFNELNQKIAQLDGTQQQNKATIDGQSREIAALKQARADDTAAFETRISAVVKAIDERPDISPELEKRLTDLQTQIGKIPAFETAKEFADFKTKVEKLRTDLDNAPKSAKVAELSDSLVALADKFASATEFKEVKDYVDGVKTKLEALLAAADLDTLITLKDTLATLRTNLSGKTTFTDADIKGFTDRIAGLEQLIDTKADIVYTPSAPLPSLPRFPKPPMGWNAWNSYQCNVNEKLIKDVTDKMVANGMKDAGYTYVNLDDCWTNRWIEATKTSEGKSNRDASGDLTINVSAFPGGMKAVADYIHSKGLRAGIYSTPNSGTCAGYSGSLHFEEQDAKKFAEWGYDYLKYDLCGGSFSSFPAMRAALDKARPGAPIYFAANPALRPSTVEVPYTTYVDAATSALDIGANWADVLSHIDQIGAFAAYATPGYINNGDMLQVGNDNTGSRDQDRAHFAMWSMLASPLIAGNKITEQSEEILKILTNKEVIAINQDKLNLQAVQLAAYSKSNPEIQVWQRPLAESGLRAVAVLNRGDSQRTLHLNFEDFGLSGTVQIRDLWQQQDQDAKVHGMDVTVAGRSAAMLKLRGTETRLRAEVDLTTIQPTYAVETVKQKECPGWKDYVKVLFDSKAAGILMATKWEKLLYCWSSDPAQAKSGMVPQRIRQDNQIVVGSAANDYSSSKATSLRIGKQTYKRGIIGSTYSQLVYRLSNQCSTFTGQFGVDDQSEPVGTAGTVTFEVWDDSKPLYATAAMKKGDEAIPFNIDVSKVETLRIIAKGSESGLFAALANPKLQCGSGT